MPLIQLETFIAAPQPIVFNISRSVDLHQFSMTHHREKVIAGVQKGLMQAGDMVTWQAYHFFKMRTLQVKITAMEPFYFFKDEMIDGDFKCMKHEHYFDCVENGTKMRDRFYFEAPFGVLGKLVAALYLKKYMTRLLLERNAVIKQIAESNDWKQYLNQ